MTNKKSSESRSVTTPSDEPTKDAEAAIAAGGHIVGTSADEPLVEGPNSK